MSSTFKFFASAVVLLGLIRVFLVEEIPPRDLTLTRMMVIRERIDQFAKQHRKLPASLAELPERAGYTNETTDAWRHPLEYSSSNAGGFTLKSLGADHRPGGEGDNGDIAGVYSLREEAVK